ncbi:hypothetical protein EYR36_000171 [Pleurotus pulmonarius]|nr:hypothetical protein EYR36_000171 [Pleurotus pulmonarius]
MSNITLPNPLTPLAFLPPALAAQFEVSRYLYAVTLGAYIWDSAVNLENDYHLLFKNKIRFPTVVYYLSRQVFVWHGHTAVRYLYIFLWVAMTGCAVTLPVGIRGDHIGPTLQCINTKVPDYTEATAIMALIYDSAVFTAISYRVITYSVIEESFSARVKTFFGKGKVSRLSNALLQSGQHYYLVALLGNVVLLILLKLPSVPAVYHGMCTIPVLALINAMACIVFRKIKFGLITDDGTTKPITDSGTISVLPAHYYRRRNADSADPTVTGIMIAKDTKVDTDQSFPIPLRDHMPSQGSSEAIGKHRGGDSV